MENKNSNLGLGMSVFGAIFFIFGFATTFIITLTAPIKEIFGLSEFGAQLLASSFFLAYPVMSIPTGRLIDKIGYKWTVVAGLVLMALGSFIYVPAARIPSFPVFLFGTFVLATGVVFLQVAANPYVSVLGKPETASSRLTMTQAFNSLGTTVAPFFGAWLIFGGMDAPKPGEVTESTVQLPYLILATALIVMALVFAFLRLPKLGKKDAGVNISGAAWQYRHLVLGALGIFVYVGAEVGIGSFLVSFITQPDIGALEAKTASHYIAWYFGGAMLGRFIGAVVMQYLAPGKVLAFNAICAVILLAITIGTGGKLAMFAVLLVGLCNSIMFPTIFSLAIAGLKQHTSQGSGILCLAIVGGAVLPLAQAALADSVSVQLAFIIPLLCYVYIAWYGAVGSKPVNPA